MFEVGGGCRRSPDRALLYGLPSCFAGCRRCGVPEADQHQCIYQWAVIVQPASLPTQLPGWGCSAHCTRCYSASTRQACSC
ncbi:Unknown protein sequence [Pseudomonas syringae pv. maculicola]|nr:Unknown protein sequence [Pseudomonas syringae pv. maculicola]